MDEETSRPLFLGKVVIKGKMEVLTGLHIGASKETVKIGGIDSPVVRDPLTNLPYIPGSSLKGKMRSISEKVFGKEPKNNQEIQLEREPNNNQDVQLGKEKKNNQEIRLHVCADKHCEICRLFGSSVKVGPNDQRHISSRLIVRDLHLTDISKNELNELSTGLPFAEWKFENSIDRITSAANPRQIERVPAGANFEFELIYDAESKYELEEDIRTILMTMEYLKLDALGGHGSRGYGKVEFNDIEYIGYPKQYYMSGEKNLIVSGNTEEDLKNIIKVFVGEGNA